MQNRLQRLDFGHMGLWGRENEQITVTLPAGDWHCLLVEQMGQVLAPVGIAALDRAIREIIKQTRADLPVPAKAEPVDDARERMKRVLHNKGAGTVPSAPKLSLKQRTQRLVLIPMMMIGDLYIETDVSLGTLASWGQFANMRFAIDVPIHRGDVAVPLMRVGDLFPRDQFDLMLAFYRAYRVALDVDGSGHLSEDAP